MNIINNIIFCHIQVVAFFKDIEGSLHISMVYVTVLKFVVYTLTMTHVSACIWFFIACPHEKGLMQKIKHNYVLRFNFSF